MKKTLRLGWMLVVEGILTREQLESVLNVQKENPALSIGEIANTHYDIPEGQIEALFVKEILSPALVDSIYIGIAKQLKQNVTEVKTIVKEIDIKLESYQRNTTASKSFEIGKNQYYEPLKDKNFKTVIKSCVDVISLETSYGKTIKFKQIDIEYDLDSQAINFDNSAFFMEAKIKLNQLIKKNNKAGKE